MDIAITQPGGGPTEGIRCRALIDTGADYCVAASDLLEAVSAPISRYVCNTGATGVEHTTIQDVDFTVFPKSGPPLLINAQAAKQSQTFVKAAYPFIIGRSILRFGTLVMDYEGGVFEWLYRRN